VPSPLPTVVPAIGRSPDGFEVSTTYRSQAVARVPGLDMPHRLCRIASENRMPTVCAAAQSASVVACELTF
jgi:hypothetical protein